jgi:HAD superfamily hydrolase (TIGR01549 family)
MSDDRPAVLFDIDGTLVDTNYFHVVAWVRAFRQEGRIVAATDVHRHVGTGSDGIIDAVAPERDRGRDDVLKAAHAEHYATFVGVMQPLRGARELVREVVRRGALAVLATSAPPDELRALRAVLKIDDAVAAVTSAADASAAKPAPGILDAALEQTGADPGAAVMVGDTRWDVLAARNAGMPCVGVLSGGISRSELADAGAAAVYRDAADLLAHLGDSPVGRLLDRAPAAPR